MKNTPENRAALERIVGTAHFLNTGYRFEIMDYDEFLTLRICQPRDTEQAAYPEIYYKDNWFGKEAVGFQIATTGYGEHSLAQAQRAANGLFTAINLVTALYTTAEIAGLTTRR